ncbi:MAG TPA: hypothetical protein VFS44_10195 [Gemmatimonadaceae bacterium]|nr:hypothetical protein [Gemmatimonadaceae bacterium]
MSAPVSWQPRRTPGSWHYVSSASTVVSLETDTLAKQVPVVSRVVYQLTATGTASPFAVSGTIDSVLVSTGGKVAPAPGKHPYAAFTGTLAPDGSLGPLSGSEPPRCPKGVDPLVAGARTLFIPTPGVLSKGSSWQDTVTTVTCRGDVPINGTTTHRYTVISDTTWQGKPALVISRTSEMLVQSDTTTPATHTLDISGSGTGTARLLIDPATAMLYQEIGQSSARLIIGTARSKVPFRQEVADTVELRP